MFKASNVTIAFLASFAIALSTPAFAEDKAPAKTAEPAVAAKTDAKTETKPEAKTETKVETKTETKTEKKTEDKKVAKKGDKAVSKPVVIMETNKGNIEIELWPDKAPVTVENFLKYVDKGHYNGTIFHRVIANFMIQGGGFSPDMKEKATDKPIKNEATNGESNKRGTLAMARTMVVDSATAQFFINTVDNNFLDHRSKDPSGYGYAVFGQVTAGMETVDAIRKVKTGNKNGYDDVPVEPVTIVSMKRK
jgi:peptidyl-prolyl cis-trans isomerase B (cyclophilin B)